MQVDHATSRADSTAHLAAALAPFERAKNYYPGVRRVVDEGDTEAWSYIASLAEIAAPYIGGAFDCEGFDLVEASFSMVTTTPEALGPEQRAPHFDSTDPDLLALLHFITPAPGSGTAFFRHRATGIEEVDERNLATFVNAARAESGRARGYVQGSNEQWEELARFDAVPDRLLIYQGSLLHSGIIPPDANLSPDPLVGRLTANLFVKVRR